MWLLLCVKGLTTVNVVKSYSPGFAVYERSVNFSLNEFEIIDIVTICANVLQLFNLLDPLLLCS
jgi:hypothetical protein